MNEREAHIHEMLCAITNSLGNRYYNDNGTLTVYMPCSAKLNRRALRPARIRVTLSAYECGILLEACLPAAVPAHGEQERKLILHQVAKLNHDTTDGGLVYQTDSGRLGYRLYCAVDAKREELDAAELHFYVMRATLHLSAGYQAVVNALDADTGVALKLSTVKRCMSMPDLSDGKETEETPRQSKAMEKMRAMLDGVLNKPWRDVVVDDGENVDEEEDDGGDDNEDGGDEA